MEMKFIIRQIKEIQQQISLEMNAEKLLLHETNLNHLTHIKRQMERVEHL